MDSKYASRKERYQPLSIPIDISDAFPLRVTKPQGVTGPNPESQ